MRFLAAIKGTAALAVIAFSTLVLTVALWVLALGKLLAPEGVPRQRVRGALARVAETWIGVNNLLLSLYRSTRWDLDLPTGLRRDGCYIVVSNHQSWVDILVLQRSFNRRLPLLRFFLKKQLIWVPFLGVAWWALDFPFMHRASREEIARRPELKGADLESARRACEKFDRVPVAMMAFPEGTRFAEDKRAATASPYDHLLKAKAGGVGQVLYALGDRLDACVDVTVDYPGRQAGAAPTFWQLLCGEVGSIRVHARAREIPAALKGGDFRNDMASRAALQDWIGALWRDKDARLQRWRDEPRTGDETR